MLDNYNKSIEAMSAQEANMRSTEIKLEAQKREELQIRDQIVRKLKQTEGDLREIVEEIAIKELILLDEKKRMKLLEKCYNKYKSLYQSVKQERNNYVSLIQIVSQDRAELKEQHKTYQR